MQRFRYIFICLLLGTIAQAQPKKGTNSSTKPNILIILADDMGYSDLGCYGSEISTPNLDLLAKEGIRYTQFYNSARCCPSRAALLTGRHPHEVGMGGMVNVRAESKNLQGPYQGYLSKSAPTIAELLKPAGYFTAMSGKWHVGEEFPSWPLQRGFDKYFGLISGPSSYYGVLVGRTMLSQNNTFVPPHDFYLTNAIGDTAISYIQKAKTDNKPIFLYTAFTAPHWPLHAPDSVVKKYRAIYRRGYDTLRQERLKRQKSLGLIPSYVKLSEREGGKPWDQVTNKDQEVEKMAVYAAMVDIMDQNVGKIIKALKKTGLYDNTIIIFLSDNGGCHENISSRIKKDMHPDDTAVAMTSGPGPRKSYVAYGLKWANLSNTPFRHHKSTIHEGGIATPFIYKPSGKLTARSKGSIVNGQGFITDIVPSCLSWAGVSPPQVFNGVQQSKLEGIELGKTFSYTNRSYCWEHEGAKGIRKGNWKLVSTRSEPWELYNLSIDRNELQDLSMQQPDLVKELESEWMKWAQKVGAKQIAGVND